MSGCCLSVQECERKVQFWCALHNRIVNGLVYTYVSMHFFRRHAVVAKATILQALRSVDIVKKLQKCAVFFQVCFASSISGVTSSETDE